MSTYLVCFAVHQFNYVERTSARGIPVSLSLCVTRNTITLQCIDEKIWNELSNLTYYWIYTVRHIPIHAHLCVLSSFTFIVENLRPAKSDRNCTIRSRHNQGHLWLLWGVFQHDILHLKTRYVWTNSFIIMATSYYYPQDFYTLLPPATTASGGQNTTPELLWLSSWYM